MFVSGLVIIQIAESPVDRLMGYVAAIFFGFCLIGYVALLATGNPRLDVDRYGFYVKTSLADGLRLEWSEIASIERTSVVNQDMIQVLPHPRIDWHTRLPWFARMVARINRQVGYHGILIARANLGENYEPAFAALTSGLARAHPHQAAPT